MSLSARVHLGELIALAGAPLFITVLFVLRSFATTGSNLGISAKSRTVELCHVTLVVFATFFNGYL